MVESAERAGMCCRCVRDGAATKPFMPVKASAAKIAGVIEIPPTAKIIAIDDCPAVRDECVVVENDSPAAMPIVSPMVKTPAEAAE